MEILLSIVGLLLNVVPASSLTRVEGHEGGEVILSCGKSFTGDIFWYKLVTLGGRESVISRSGNTVIPGQQWADHVDIMGDCNLFIRNLIEDRDEGTFVFQPGEATEELTVVIVFVVPVIEAAIIPSTNGIVSVSTGGSTTLTCRVVGLAVNPPKTPIIFCWMIGGGTGVCNGTEARFTLDKPDKSLNIKTITCNAKNYYSNGDVLGSADGIAVLDVTYIDEVQLEPSHTVIENSSVILQCIVDGNPTPRFEWSKSGMSVSATAEYIITNVPRTAAGVYTCQASNIEGSNRNNLVLSVLYPPEINLTYQSNILNCTANGVPAIYNFSLWEHSFDGNIVRTLPGTSSDLINQNFLHLPSITYQDMGAYTCMVSNGIGAPQKKQVLVRPETPATFDIHQKSAISVEATSSAEISVSFYSHPAPYKVQWRKSSNGEILESHREESGAILLSLHGVTISVQGYFSVLTLAYVSEATMGNYTFTVTNRISGVDTPTEFVIYLSLSENDVQLGSIVGGVMGGIVLAVVLVVLFVIWYRRRQSNINDHDKSGGPEVSRQEAGADRNRILGMRSLNNAQDMESNRKMAPGSVVVRKGPSLNYSTNSTTQNTNVKNAINGNQPAANYGLINVGVAVPGTSVTF